VIVNSSESVRTAFEADGLQTGDFERLRYFDDLEHATEWCEDQIAENEARKIEAAKMEGAETVADLFQAVYADMMAALEIQVMFETLIERMQAYLDKFDVSAGEYLYRRDEISADLYFIVRGQVTLAGTNPEGTSYRFRTLGPWTLTGEIGAFLGYHAPYDAAVVKAGLIYRLTAENRKKLEAENAALASDLQRLIITMLGSQLMKTTRAVGGIAG